MRSVGPITKNPSVDTDIRVRKVVIHRLGAGNTPPSGKAQAG